MASIIPLLTEFEKEHISERQALPEKYLGLSDAEMDARIAAARANARRPARDPRPSLSARRGHQVRRLHRRLVPPRPADRQPSRGRLHRVLRRALHGRERGRALRAASAGDPAGPGRRLLDGRHGRARPARDLLGRADADGHHARRQAAPWCRSPTSTRPPRSRRSSASAAAPSARRRTRWPR